MFEKFKSLKLRTKMLVSILTVASIALVNQRFRVWEDPRIADVEYFMAGANCGGCGYAGCSAAANAVVAGKAPVSVCIVGGQESAVNIADCINMFMIGAHSLINLYPAPIMLNTDGFKPQPFNIGNSAQGNQECLGF